MELQQKIDVMTYEQALDWKGRFYQSAYDFRDLLIEGYEGEVWLALGYPDWTKCLLALAQECGFSASQAWRELEAAKIEGNLLARGLVENNRIPERQLRPLAGLEPDQQREVWQEAVRTSNGKMTGAHVKQIVENRKEPIETPPFPDGRYRCIVIDPPWPVKKVEQLRRPNQGIELDYPTMSLDEIASLPIAGLADESGCHLYLWVTQKYLPAGLEIVEGWGFKYQCLMTWNKNTGVSPYSWMYDTEHVIFAHCGGLKLSQWGLRLSFNETVRRGCHSMKPDVFYNERVILASPEPRLEMFARQEREGFEVWGNEV